MKVSIALLWWMCLRVIVCIEPPAEDARVLVSHAFEGTLTPSRVFGLKPHVIFVQLLKLFFVYRHPRNGSLWVSCAEFIQFAECRNVITNS